MKHQISSSAQVKTVRCHDGLIVATGGAVCLGRVSVVVDNEEDVFAFLL